MCIYSFTANSSSSFVSGLVFVGPIFFLNPCVVVDALRCVGFLRLVFPCGKKKTKQRDGHYSERASKRGEKAKRRSGRREKGFVETTFSHTGVVSNPSSSSSVVLPIFSGRFACTMFRKKLYEVSEQTCWYVLLPLRLR